MKMIMKVKKNTVEKYALDLLRTLEERQKERKDRKKGRKGRRNTNDEIFKEYSGAVEWWVLGALCDASIENNKSGREISPPPLS